MAVRLWGLLTALEQRCSAAASLSCTSSSSSTSTGSTTTAAAGNNNTSFCHHHHHHRVPSHSYYYNNRRSCSGEAAASAALGGGAAGGGTGGEDEAEAQREEAEDLATRKRLEQALIELRIHNAAPDWLPLFPGGSYWIHPDQIGLTNKGPENPSGLLLDPVNDREFLAMVTPMGWPVESAAGDAMNPKSGSTR